MKRMPWVAVASILLGALGWAGLRLQSTGLLWGPPCPLKQMTGLACLSCGMTRCLTALFQGDFRQAFHWHPIGLLGLLLLPLVGIWDVARALRGLDYPSLPESSLARWTVAGILAGTWCLQAVRGI